MEKIEVEDRILASGGFADVRCGRYMGHLVAVKTLRVAEQDDFAKIRKVGINVCFFPLPGTLSQPFRSSNSVRRSSSGAHYLTRTS